MKMTMMLLALGLASNRAVVGAFRPALALSFLSSSSGPSQSRRKAVTVDTYFSHVSRGTRRMMSSDSSDESQKPGSAVDGSSREPGVDADADADAKVDKKDKFAVYRNNGNRRDQVFSALSGDGGIKVTAATARNLLNEMMMQQTLTEIPTEALGRTLICALLMSNGIQEEQNVQITMNGDGPLRGVVAIASGAGGVRGYVGSPMLGDISLVDAVGKGTVQIVKNHPSWPRPFNGITAIRHSDIDRDIGIYLAESEQRSCVLAAATSVSGVLCKAAGGYLIEQLPGCEPETIQKIEENLAKLVEMDGGDKLPTNLLLNGKTPLDIAEIILDGLDMEPLQQIEPKAVCDCSEDRLLRSLRLLPKAEVEEILETEEKVEARCQFCGTVYSMGGEQLRQKLAAATGDPSKDSDME